jgi:hypothetical protein
VVAPSPITVTDTNLSTNGPPIIAGHITAVTLRCKLVDLKNVGADANTKFAYMFEKALTNSVYIVPESTRLNGDLDPAGDNQTYVFQVNLTLKRPMKL